MGGVIAVPKGGVIEAVVFALNVLYPADGVTGVVTPNGFLEVRGSLGGASDETEKQIDLSEIAFGCSLCQIITRNTKSNGRCIYLS